MVNEAELTEAVWWVEEQAELPELERTWNQREYFTDVALMNEFTIREGNGLFRDPNVCGTTFCVAGHIAFKHGWQPVNIHPGDGTTAFVAKDGQERYVDNVAAEILGLETVKYDAHSLFLPYNSADDVRKIAEELLGREIPPRPGNVQP